MSTLSTHGQAVPVPQAPVGADVHETLDVHRHLSAQGTFDLELVLDDIPYLCRLLVGEIPCLRIKGHFRLSKDLASARTTDSEYVCQSDLDMLIVGYINSNYTRHKKLLPSN